MQVEQNLQLYSAPASVCAIDFISIDNNICEQITKTTILLQSFIKSLPADKHWTTKFYRLIPTLLIILLFALLLSLPY